MVPEFLKQVEASVKNYLQEKNVTVEDVLRIESYIDEDTVDFLLDLYDGKIKLYKENRELILVKDILMHDDSLEFYRFTEGALKTINLPQKLENFSQLRQRLVQLATEYKHLSLHEFNTYIDEVYSPYREYFDRNDQIENLQQSYLTKVFVSKIWADGHAQNMLPMARELLESHLSQDIQPSLLVLAHLKDINKAYKDAVNSLNEMPESLQESYDFDPLKASLSDVNQLCAALSEKIDEDKLERAEILAPCVRIDVASFKN